MNPNLQLLGILSALVIGVLAWLRYSLPKAAAQDTARRLRMFEMAGISGDVEWIPEKEVFVFKHAGRYCSLRYVSEGPSFVDVGEGYNVDASTTWACLETQVDFKGAFSLRRKGAAQRLLGVAGVSKSVPSGDHRFDDHFIIVSNTPDLTSTYFSDGERRRVVRELFGLGYKGIDQNRGLLSLYWVPYMNDSSGGDGPILKAGLESMRLLAGDPNVQ